MPQHSPERPSHFSPVPSRPVPSRPVPSHYPTRFAQPVLPAPAAAHEGGHVRAVQDGDGQSHGLQRGEHQVR